MAHIQPQSPEAVVMQAPQHQPLLLETLKIPSPPPLHCQKLLLKLLGLLHRHGRLPELLVHGACEGDCSVHAGGKVAIGKHSRGGVSPGLLGTMGSKQAN